MTKEEKDKLEAAVKAARRIPMTIEEEYRNADVPMPNDMLNASNTEKFGLKKIINDIFGKAKKDADEEESDYRGGKAYHAFLKLFYKNKKEEDEK